MPFAPSTLFKISAGIILILTIAATALGYHLAEARKEIRQQDTKITKLQANITSTEISVKNQGTEIMNLKTNIELKENSIRALYSSINDLKTQLSVVRVALQQSTNIRVDSSGAIITRKGSKNDGIELR